MGKIIFNTIIWGLLIAATSCNRPQSGEKSLNDYFAGSLPDTIPVLFFPERLHEEMNIRDITFSIDYKEFYFTQITSDTFIMMSTYIPGGWTIPSVSPFSGSFSDFEPFMTPDGNYLYFSSKRPSKDKFSMEKDIDIWRVHRMDSGWSVPGLLDKPVNSKCMEYYPSVSGAGNLYFGRNDSALTRGDIYVSQLINNNYSEPQKLPEPVNSPETSFNAFISPDERYIIFSAYIQENDSWHSDLYISYRNRDGNWEGPKNLGQNINSGRNDFSPWVSYDGRFLFFTSTRLDTTGMNRKYNIFWVRTSAIEDFNQLILRSR